MTTAIRRGDIFLVKLDNGGGSIQQGVRPCLVVSNNKCNHFSDVVHVAPITTRDKPSLPTHVHIEEQVLRENSMVLVEQTQLVNKQNLIHYLTSIYMSDEIEQAIRVQFGLVR